MAVKHYTNVGIKFSALAQFFMISLIYSKFLEFTVRLKQAKANHILAACQYFKRNNKIWLNRPTCLLSQVRKSKAHQATHDNNPCKAE